MSGTPEEDAVGGPAFPTDYHAECSQCKAEVYGATSHGGMTLLDYFAAAALPAIQVGCVEMAKLGQEHGHIEQARAAYLVAKAMLKERMNHLPSRSGSIKE